MQEIEIINEMPLSLAEMKEKLEAVKKGKEELGFRATKTEEYLNYFAKAKDTSDLKKKLEALDIQRMKDKHIAKIVDLRPIDEDSVKAILSTDNVTLKQDDVQKIVETVKA